MGISDTDHGPDEGTDRVWQAQYPQRDIVPTPRALQGEPEFNPYDNWPRYSQWWPEPEKGD